MKPWTFAAAGIALLLASCAGPGGSGGLQHDKWGHRPGPKGFHTVIIDAGHGGKDSGAISRSTGAQEKDLALDTAQRLQRQLSGKVKVVMMRKGDSFIELDDRAEARLCSDPAYRERMASALARAILDQQANGDAGSLPKPIYAPPSRPTDPPGS
jgi:N-acetylmuramoyl-L-alanine amidase